MTWGVLCVRSLIWNTAASGKEILPREIYEQAAPAVAIVIEHADGGRKKGVAKRGLRTLTTGVSSAEVDNFNGVWTITSFKQK